MFRWTSGITTFILIETTIITETIANLFVCTSTVICVRCICTFSISVTVMTTVLASAFIIIITYSALVVSFFEAVVTSAPVFAILVDTETIDIVTIISVTFAFTFIQISTVESVARPSIISRTVVITSNVGADRIGITHRRVIKWILFVSNRVNVTFCAFITVFAFKTIAIKSFQTGAIVESIKIKAVLKKQY